ncbi:hypothetical protein VSK92_14600 [Bacillus swezeyi]|uniref:hypothetical protein n=1 Tax=Bacillus swezeyi TaxID=1925020 RepID=UPI0039C6E739
MWQLQIDWSIIISVSIPLLAATSGQLIAHYFSQSREALKFKKECFQNLYSPVIFLITYYLFSENIKYVEMISENYSEEEYKKNNTRNFHNPNKLFKEILDMVGSNLKYENQDLGNSFLRYVHAVFFFKNPESIY